MTPWLKAPVKQSVDSPCQCKSHHPCQALKSSRHRQSERLDLWAAAPLAGVRRRHSCPPTKAARVRHFRCRLFALQYFLRSLEWQIADYRSLATALPTLLAANGTGWHWHRHRHSHLLEPSSCQGRSADFILQPLLCSHPPRSNCHTQRYSFIRPRIFAVQARARFAHASSATRIEHRKSCPCLCRRHCHLGDRVHCRGACAACTVSTAVASPSQRDHQGGDRG